MTDLPLQPRLDPYGESKENLRRKSTEHSAMARKAVDHFHTLIANDPDDRQNYPYYARDLGLTVEEMESAVTYGDHNGIAVEVNAEGHRALARFKK